MTIQSAPTKTQIQDVKDAVTQAYSVTIEGVAEDLSQEPNSQGNYPRKLFKGAIQPIVLDALGVQSRVFEEYAALLAKGYTASTVDCTMLLDKFATYSTQVFMVKPEAVQAEELKVLHAAAEADLRASMLKLATAQIEVEIQAALTKQIAEEAAAEQAAKAAQRARIERDIRTAHGLK